MNILKNIIQQPFLLNIVSICTNVILIEVIKGHLPGWGQTCGSCNNLPSWLQSKTHNMWPPPTPPVATVNWNSTVRIKGIRHLSTASFYHVGWFFQYWGILLDVKYIKRWICLLNQADYWIQDSKRKRFPKVRTFVQNVVWTLDADRNTRAIMLSLALLSSEDSLMFLCFSCFVQNDHLYSASNPFSQVSKKKAQTKLCPPIGGLWPFVLIFGKRRHDGRKGKSICWYYEVISRHTHVSPIHFASRYEQDNLIHFPVIGIKLM